MLASRSTAPAAARSRGVTALTAPAVPTGMNAGVSTGPCGVSSRPRRARPSLAVTSNMDVCVTPVTYTTATRGAASRWRSLRRPIERARSVARIRRRHLRPDRPGPLRPDPPVHRQVRALARRRQVRRRPNLQPRLSRAPARPGPCRQLRVPRRISLPTRRNIRSSPSPATRPGPSRHWMRISATVAELALDVVFPYRPWTVRRGRHAAGTPGTGECPLRRGGRARVGRRHGQGGGESAPEGSRTPGRSRLRGRGRGMGDGPGRSHRSASRPPSTTRCSSSPRIWVRASASHGQPTRRDFAVPWRWPGRSTTSWSLKSPYRRPGRSNVPFSATRLPRRRCRARSYRPETSTTMKRSTSTTAPRLSFLPRSPPLERRRCAGWPSTPTALSTVPAWRASTSCSTTRATGCT